MSLNIVFINDIVNNLREVGAQSSYLVLEEGIAEVSRSGPRVAVAQRGLHGERGLGFHLRSIICTGFEQFW